MSKTIRISVAKDFSIFPAGRFPTDGPHNGERFRKQQLEPAFKKNAKIVVELDGTRGYGSSFLDEAFGGLVRVGIAPALIENRLELVSDDLSLIVEIEQYIREAAEQLEPPKKTATA